MKINLSFLSDTLAPYLIAIFIAGGVILLGVIIFLIIFLRKRNANPKIDNSKWIEALGGKDNIINVTAVGSRINLTLKDKDAINREKLTEYGVKSVLVMSNKVTLVKEKAVDTAQAINEALQ